MKTPEQVFNSVQVPGYTTSGGEQLIYNDLAPIYEIIYSDLEELYDVHESIVRNHFSKGDKLLEIGVGTGILTRRLEDDFEIVGIDINQGMLKIADEKTDIELREQDVRDINYKNEFDGVLSLCQPISYMTTDKEFDKYISNIYRALKPGGKVVGDSFTPQMGESNVITRENKDVGDLEVKFWIEPEDYSQNTWNSVMYIQLIRNGFIKALKDRHPARGFKQESIRRKLENKGFSSVGTGILGDKDHYEQDSGVIKFWAKK